MASSTGIRKRHGRGCRNRNGGTCNCHPTYEAWVWSPRDGRKIYRSFPTESAAKGWRADATGAVRRGGMRATSPQTVAEAAEAWIAKAERGEIKKRGGRDYKPAVVRGYRADLRRYVVPALGGHRISHLRRRDVQELLVDDLVAKGKSGSKVLNVLNALRAIVRPARRDDELGGRPDARP